MTRGGKGAGLTRGPDGTYTRSSETAERDAYACTLRERGLSYRAIAEQMGYHNHSGARFAVERALKAIVQEPAEDLRTLELARLDRMWQACVKVLETTHYTVSEGRLVWIGPEGEARPLEDDGPVLAAIDRMLKIQDRRAKLLGLDAPVKVNANLTAAPPVPEVDAMIAQARERMAARN